MKKLLSLSLALLAAAAMTVPTLAASHTVQRGDTMWKLAVQYQVGTSEIIDANPQVANPNLIYPGDVLDIPETDGLRPRLRAGGRPPCERRAREARPCRADGGLGAFPRRALQVTGYAR